MILKLRHHPGAAGAGANALLEGLDCYIGPRTGLVPAVLHGEQCAVGVWLDAQFKRAANSLKDHAGLSIGDRSHGTVHAVAALLRAQIRLGHIGHCTIHRTDGELILHVAIAFSAAANIMHCIKNLVQAERLAKTWNFLTAGNAMQHAGDQHAAVRSLVGIGNHIMAAFVGDFGHDLPTIGGLLC